MIKKGLLYGLPFLLFFAAVLCFVLWFSQYLVSDSFVSAYATLLTNGSTADGTVTPGKVGLISAKEAEDEILEGTFPMPDYAAQWATMNVAGWKEKDIPVYYGNSAELLRAGAGQAQYSRFPGQRGKTVLSAHVNRHFYEIEDAAERFEAGEEVLVTLDTLWGRYVYRVAEVVIFDYNDFDPLMPAEGQDSLFFYTCYPRRNSLAFKAERIGLRCECISGATWEGYVDAS